MGVLSIIKFVLAIQLDHAQHGNMKDVMELIVVNIQRQITIQLTCLELST